MKKLILSFGLCAAFMVGMSSCAKETCYTCSIDNGTEQCTADICDRTLTYSGNATGCSGTLSMPDGETHEGTKNTLEAAGYTCVAQ